MLAMWVPELPFQLACQRETGLRERPLAFLSPEPGSGPVLWLVNRLARAEGLAPGDPLDLALRRARGLQVLDAQPQTWWEAQSCLGEFLQHWTPQGVLGRMGEALVELRGTDRIFGPPQDAAERIRRDLAERHGWQSHGGLSASATAAQVAARMERRLEQVGEGAEAPFLAPHPIGRLPDLNPRLRFRLRRLGLRLLGDLQPVPPATLAQLMPRDEAPKLLARARGEDRIRLPLLTEPPGRSSHLWRLEPPRLPEEIALASWCLRHLWAEARAPRHLDFRWWDVDGQPHRWQAPPEALQEPPLALARLLEAAFLEGATRRLLVHRLSLRVRWGLGQPMGLFQAESSQRLGRLESTLARLRRRFPAHPVVPGWMCASP